ncbi:imm11 family protein [Botrimarina colliarenosi]|nr:DUF1629 domain-containing protein [Botrimarina colliarenosi]
MRYYWLYDDDLQYDDKTRCLHIAATLEGGPREDWEYIRGARFPEEPPVKLVEGNDGVPCPLYLQGYGILVVEKELGEVLRGIAGDSIQLIPCQYEAQPDLFLLNTLSMVDCLDWEASVIECYHPQGLSSWPNKRGEIDDIGRLVFDADKAAGNAIFRLPDWNFRMFINQDVKDALILYGAVDRHVFYEVNTECLLIGGISYYEPTVRKRVPWSLEEYRAMREERREQSSV